LAPCPSRRVRKGEHLVAQQAKLNPKVIPNREEPVGPVSPAA
jgi:hypothetical protein